MSYRRKSEAALRWRKWRLRNRAAIEIAGIPEKVLKDELTWLVFLEHGWFDKFNVDSLSTEQKQALYDWLATELSETEKQSVCFWLEIKAQLNKSKDMERV
jgi:hypothetical protein